MGVSINGGTPKWLVCMGNPIKMDDLGVSLFQETCICLYIYIYTNVRSTSRNITLIEFPVGI